MITRSIALLLILSAFGSACAAQSSTKDPDWRHRQEVWWKSSDALVGAIVTFARVRALAEPDSIALGDVTDSQIGLLLILDGDSSDLALQNLARLSSYYFGEAPSEVYQCVVVRKGARMLPFLREQLTRKDSDDCVVRYNDSHLCMANLHPNGHQGAVTALIRAIETDAHCTFER